MQPVAQHADKKEQDAVRLFVEAQRVVEEAEEQLQQLFTYREEYSKKILPTDSRETSGQRLQDFQSFLATLAHTIEQLHIDIENKKNLCEMKRQAWLKCRGRSHALNSVVEKYKLEEFKQLEKYEQNEQDEHAARVTNNKKKS